MVIFGGGNVHRRAARSTGHKCCPRASYSTERDQTSARRRRPAVGARM